MHIVDGTWWNRALWSVLAGALAACGGETGDANNANNQGADCSAPSAFPGPVEGDLVVEAGCYLVEADISVSDGDLLTLSPGVTLIFESGLDLVVDGGRLSAEGTAGAPIILRGEQPTRGFWEGVRFDESNFVENVWTHVTLQDAGSDDGAALYLDDDSGPVRLLVRNSTIRGSAGYGIYLESNQNPHDLDFGASTVTDNAVAARILAKDIEGLAGDSTWTGNDDDYIETGAGVSSDATWPALDVPYRVADSIDVNEATITVQAGATFEFTQGTELTVGANSGFTAVGTESAPIVFTGAQPTRGHWSGLIFDSSNSVDNVLEHVVVEYGGGGGDTGANVYVDDDNSASRLAIRNTTLRESAAWAMYFEINQNNHELDAFEGNTVTANAQAIRMGAEDAGELSTSSTFVGNDEDYVELHGAARSSQTWPAIDAPYRIPTRLDIAEGAEVIIEAGATVELAQNAGFDISGALAAEGTMDAPVTFTGVQKTAGYWGSINYDSTGSTGNVLRWTVIEYGGGATDDNSGLVYLDDDRAATRLTLDNATFRESSNWGIYVENNQNDPILSCTDVTFEAGSLAEGAVGNSDGALPNLCP